MAKKEMLVIKVASKSEPDKKYDVKLYDDWSMSCPCKRWIFSGADRFCHHIEAAEAHVFTAAERLQLKNFVVRVA